MKNGSSLDVLYTQYVDGKRRRLSAKHRLKIDGCTVDSARLYLAATGKRPWSECEWQHLFACAFCETYYVAALREAGAWEAAFVFMLKKVRYSHIVSALQSAPIKTVAVLSSLNSEIQAAVDGLSRGTLAPTVNMSRIAAVTSADARRNSSIRHFRQKSALAIFANHVARQESPPGRSRYLEVMVRDLKTHGFVLRELIPMRENASVPGTFSGVVEIPIDEKLNLHRNVECFLIEPPPCFDGDSPNITAIWTKSLSEPDRDQLEEILHSAALFGKAVSSPAFVERLVALITDANQANIIRAAAARALGSTGDASTASRATLTALLVEKDAAMRIAGAEGLGGLGPAAVSEPVRSGLAGLLSGERSERIAAMFAIIDLGPSAATAEAMLAMENLTKSTDSFESATAAGALKALRQ